MRAITAGCLTAILLLSACTAGSGSRPEAEASPSGSASVTSPPPSRSPSAAPPVSQAPEPPPAKDDRRGKVAFARYVLQAWIYALNTNDAQVLLDVSGAKPCDGCGKLARELEKRERQGWYTALEGVRVSAVKVTTSGRATRVRMSVAIPASETYHDDGTFRSSNPAHPRETFEVSMVNTGKRFRLESFGLH